MSDTKFKVGDRVCVTSERKNVWSMLPHMLIHPPFRDVDGTWWVLAIPVCDPLDNVDYANDPDSISDLERNAVTKSVFLRLDEIRHDGPPMIAMTPERIAALEDAADALDYQHLMRASNCDTPREDDVNIAGGCMCKEYESAVRAMLAEARGERAS